MPLLQVAAATKPLELVRDSTERVLDRSNCAYEPYEQDDRQHPSRKNEKELDGTKIEWHREED